MEAKAYVYAADADFAAQLEARKAELKQAFIVSEVVIAASKEAGGGRLSRRHNIKPASRPSFVCRDCYIVIHTYTARMCCLRRASS